MEKNFSSKSATLILDIGNSNLVGSVATPGNAAVTKELYRVKTPASHLSELELEKLLDPWISLAPSRSTQWMIASVVPMLDSKIESIAEKRGSQCTWIRADLDRSFDLSIPYPNQLGADRLANLQAVSCLIKKNEAALIIDAGTATKFCVLVPHHPKHRYMGGLITPGLEISYDALVARAAKLSEVQLSPPSSAIGNTTESQIQSGFFFPHAAMIEGMTDLLIQEMKQNYQLDQSQIRLFATGGCLKRITLSERFDWIPALTLQGIAAYADLKNS